MNKRSQSLAPALVLLLLIPCLAAYGQEMTITTSSDDARQLFVDGRNKFENIEFPAAAELFDKAIRKDPSFAMAYLYRSQSGGGSEVFRTNLDKAVSLVDKVSPGERLMILAGKANSDGNMAEFRKDAEGLLKLYPNDKRARMLMGNYCGVDGDYKGAAAWYEKSIEADPNFASAYNILGYARKILGDYPAAEKAFKKYAELAPGSANPPDSYAELLLKMGRFDESIEWYQKALSIDPTFTGSIAGVGFGYIHKGNFAKARESFEDQYNRSTQINARLTALMNIAYSHLNEWDVPGALKALERYRVMAQKENPPSVITSYLFAGYINFESGNLSQAQKDLEQAQKLNESTPRSPAAKSATKVNLDLLQCYILMRGKDLQGARKNADECAKNVKARNIDVEKRNLNLMLANLECEVGNHDKALALLDNGPIDDPYTMFTKAVAYERKGDAANAREWYKKTANWNWTGFSYALVRSRALKKSM